MADQLDKQLNKAIEEVLKDYNKVLAKAVTYASNIALTDIRNKAMSCLYMYYNNYEPHSYRRTYELWHSILPYMQIKNSKDKIHATVGVEYDASMLDTYNGSKKYTPTDGRWVLDNFLQGIHPGTDGSTIARETPYDNDTWLSIVSKYGHIDDVTPENVMQLFIEKYYDTFNKNMFMRFIAEVGKRM